MTLTLHPTARVARTTRRPVSRRQLAARVLVVLAAAFVVWIASLPAGGAPAQQIAPGPPSSVEILSAMHAQS
jgi:hypothetical protein